MTNPSLSRDRAWALVTEHVSSESLRRHLLGAEAADYDKISDTLDVWFDSGTTHWHVLRGSHPLGHEVGPRADLYLLLEPDVAWVDDGTRVYGSDDSRARFARLTRDVLDEAGVNWVSIRGDWDARFTAAIAAIEGFERG